MFGIKQAIRLARKERLWRRVNPHNDTHIGNVRVNTDLITVGKGTYGYLNVDSTGTQGHLTIGSFCSIAPGVLFIINNEHPLNLISTYPFQVKVTHDCSVEALSRGGIHVDDDVWIGTNAIILDGVSIGRGAVVAAGAVVTKDVSPYAVVGGCPAKVIKMRFDQKHIDLLSSIDFKNLSPETIRRNIALFYKPVDALEPSDIDAIVRGCSVE